MAPAHEGDELCAEINVTPLVDVLLVLLVILMVVTPMLRFELPVDVPSATTATAAVDSDRRLTISVAADGTIRLGDVPVARADLRAVLAQTLAEAGEQGVFLEADRATAYATVIDVMDVARAAGVQRVGVVTAAADG